MASHTYTPTQQSRKSQPATVKSEDDSVQNVARILRDDDNSVHDEPKDHKRPVLPTPTTVNKEQHGLFSTVPAPPPPPPSPFGKHSDPIKDKSIKVPRTEPSMDKPQRTPIAPHTIRDFIEHPHTDTRSSEIPKINPLARNINNDESHFKFPKSLSEKTQASPKTVRFEQSPKSAKSEPIKETTPLPLLPSPKSAPPFGVYVEHQAQPTTPTKLPPPETKSLPKSVPPPTPDVKTSPHPVTPIKIFESPAKIIKPPSPPSLPKSAPPQVQWPSKEQQRPETPVKHPDEHVSVTKAPKQTLPLFKDTTHEIGKQCIVCDSGSGYIKIGLAGENTPRLTFPSVVGVPRRQAVLLEVGHKDMYIGDEAQHKRGVLTLSHPTQHGIVCDWNALEKIWYYSFNNLGIDTAECNLLLTECPLNPKANREKMVELAFEQFNARGCYIAIQAVLALYTTGNITGLVMDSGDGVTHTVPIYEGYCLPHAINRLDVGGKDLTLYLSRILTERGINLTTTAEMEIVRDIKEKLSYVAQDYDEELNLSASGVLDKEYILPDGQTITVSNERFRCAEVLFRPHMIGIESSGISDSAYNTIMQSDIDLRKSMFANVILSGGNSMFPGIEQRLHLDISKKVPPSVEVKCYSVQDRKNAVYMGGSILASLTSFAPMWITHSEYEEFGAKHVHRKCF